MKILTENSEALEFKVVFEHMYGTKPYHPYEDDRRSRPTVQEEVRTPVKSTHKSQSNLNQSRSPNKSRSPNRHLHFTKSGHNDNLGQLGMSYNESNYGRKDCDNMDTAIEAYFRSQFTNLIERFIDSILADKGPTRDPKLTDHEYKEKILAIVNRKCQNILTSIFRSNKEGFIK